MDWLEIWNTFLMSIIHGNIDQNIRERKKKREKRGLLKYLYTTGNFFRANIKGGLCFAFWSVYYINKTRVVSEVLWDRNVVALIYTLRCITFVYVEMLALHLTRLHPSPTFVLYISHRQLNNNYSGDVTLYLLTYYTCMLLLLGRMRLPIQRFFYGNLYTFRKCEYFSTCGALDLRETIGISL